MKETGSQNMAEGSQAWENTKAAIVLLLDEIRQMQLMLEMISKESGIPKERYESFRQQAKVLSAQAGLIASEQRGKL